MAGILARSERAADSDCLPDGSCDLEDLESCRGRGFRVRIGKSAHQIDEIPVGL